MAPFLGFVVGLFTTLVLIPPLSRASGFLSLQDAPGVRKIHTMPVPCVGGVGIVAGVFTAILVLLPLEPYLQIYLAVGTVIFLLGVIDDGFDINYRWKFVIQILAITLAVHGGIVLERLPFFGFEPVSPWLSYPISVVFLLGLVNAVNLFDGLDGLAGGCMLLTLGAVVFLARVSGGGELILLTLSVMGATLAFLYFNTHPARVFMGDAGSQFLGFTAGALVILLTQETNTALNPAIVFLLLGMPILDTIWVVALRLYQGRSPFVGDRQHLHHQLLNLGLGHGGAVATIYVVQATMVATGCLLMYQGDFLVSTVFVLESLVIIGFILVARALGWRWDWNGGGRGRQLRRPTGRVHNVLMKLYDASPVVIEGALSVFIVTGALAAGRLSLDFSVLALILAGAMAFAAILVNSHTRLITRVALYVSSLIALVAIYPLTQSNTIIDSVTDIFLFVLALAVAISIRAAREELFQVTPQDLLVALFAIALPNLPDGFFGELPLGYFFFRAIVLFYACEYVISIAGYRYVRLRMAVFASLIIVAAHGWIA